MAPISSSRRSRYCRRINIKTRRQSIRQDRKTKGLSRASSSVKGSEKSGGSVARVGVATAIGASAEKMAENQ